MNNKSIKKNAFLNIIKQVCSILFPLITYPYISRMLGSSSYGVYSFADSIVSYGVLIAGLGINSYAIREGAIIRNDSEKINEFSSEVFSINIISTVVAYILLVCSLFLSSRIMDDGNVILVRSLIIILTTIGVDWINNIYEDFAYITVRYIIFQSISLVLMFVFIRSSKDIIPYTFITVIAAAGGNLLNVVYVRKYVKVKLTFKHLSKHLKPIMILFANNVAVAIYVNSDITMLGFFTSNKEIGIYALASKIYNLAKLMINAVVMVMVPRLSFLVTQKDKYQEFVIRTARYLMYISFPIVCGFSILSRQIIYIVGGQGYLSGALSLSILSFAIIGAIGGSFFSNCILLENKRENFILISTSIAAILNILLNIILIPLMGIAGSSLTTLIAEFTAFILEAIYSKKYIPIKKLLNISMIYCLVGCLFVCVICFSVSWLISNPIVSILISVPLSIIGYIAIVIKDCNIHDEILAFLIKR